MCKVHTGYHGSSKIEHGLCACTVVNPRAKARRLSLRAGTKPLRTGVQTMLYLSLVASVPIFVYVDYVVIGFDMEVQPLVTHNAA